MINKVLKYLEENLSEKRVSHTKGVVETAVKLCEKYGGEKEKVVLSAYLHDVAKEKTLEEMNALTGHLDLDSTLRKSKSLLHGPAGACLARNLFAVDDEVYNGIFYHTMGRDNMTLTEKIVFVADMAEPSRKFKGIGTLRKVMNRNLDEAVILSADLTIKFLIENNKPIYPLTVITRNYIINEKNSGN